MKKYLLIVLFLLNGYGYAFTQATCPPGINENFDGLSNSYVSTGTPGWTIDSNFFTSSPKSIRGQFNPAGSIELTSPAVSTLGFSIVVLKFKHICKVSPNDGGIIEINSGSGWVQLRTAPSPSANCVYTGSASTFTSSFGWKFNALSYPLLWLPGQDAAVPNNIWWKQESFDISIAAANQATFQIRFKVGDGGANGMIGNYGWLIDDIEFCFSTCEMIPPIIVAVPPVLSGVVNTSGPYTLCFDISDASSIVMADLVFSINGNPFSSIGGLQQVTATQWCGLIPVTLNLGDTICWYVQAYDGSCNFNMTTYPPLGTNICAQYDYGDPPFCEEFDGLSTNWQNNISSMDPYWKLGPPICGLINSPFSFPKSWFLEVNDNGGFSFFFSSFLYSGIYDFTGAYNAKLNFWYNTSISTISNNGVSLDYSVNNGVNWFTLGNINDSCSKNWFNDSAFLYPAWIGTSNGWTNASYNLKCIPAIAGAANVRFRFGYYGHHGMASDNGCFSLDNFCISLPPENDMAVVSIISPRKKAPTNFPIPVKVTIENAGNATQTLFNLVTSIRPSGGSWNIVNTFPWSGSIAPGQRINITLPNVILPTGPFRICVNVLLLGDTNVANNQACNKVIGNTNPINNDGSFQNSIYWNDDTLSFFSEEPGDGLDNLFADRIIYNSVDEFFKIYPNPVKEFLYISFDHKFMDPFFVSIKSLSGQVVISQTYSSESLSKIELKLLAPGIYFAHIIADGRSYFTKLLKE